MQHETRLDVVICGAGLGGLSAAIATALGGHKVRVLEATKELAEIGAGLQITPNGAKLLRAWGIGEEAEDMSAIPTSCIVRRYSGKTLVLEERFDEKLRQDFGEPFFDIHRADLQKLLYRRACELGVNVLLGCRVAEIKHESRPEITLQSGERLECDLLIGADGLWSKCRESLLGVSDKPLPTGDLAYRIVLSIDQLEDQNLKDLVGNPTTTFWVGPYSHAVGYSLKSATVFNLVLLCPDDLPENTSREKGSVDEMKALFQNWDPILTRLLDHVKDVEKWKLMHLKPLGRWTNASKTFALMGDACHPMLPYLAQGANSALEDGAVLGRLLGYVKQKDQLPLAIGLYEELRKVRGDTIAAGTFTQRDNFHMPDGPEQEERDRQFAAQFGKKIESPFPCPWVDPESQKWLYGYDAYSEADAAALKNGLKV